MRNRRLFPVLFGGGVSVPSYIFRDDFSDDRIAGTITGTTTTDGKTTRTSPSGAIASGYYNLDGVFSPSLWFDLAITREFGRVLAFRTKPIYNQQGDCGFDADKTGAMTSGIRYGSAYIKFFANGVVDTKLGLFAIPAPASNCIYDTWIILRSSGLFIFVQGNELVTPTLVYYNDINNTASGYFCLGGQIDFACVPTDKLSVYPLVSDSFAGADSAMDGRLSNGLGHLEADGHGSSIAWSDTVGTSAIVSNRASFSALSGGVGITTINQNNDDVIIRANVYRSAGEAGIICRYTDANNYIRVTHDGTNILITTVVGGVATTQTKATAYAAGGKIMVSVHGNQLVVFYNGDCVLVSTIGNTTITDAVLLSGIVGLYSTNTGNTFDDFQVFGKTSNGI